MQREDAVTDAAPGKPRPTRAPELNPFEAVNFFFDRAADHVGLKDEMRAIFRESATTRTRISTRCAPWPR
jgi:hypothetical protein